MNLGYCRCGENLEIVGPSFGPCLRDFFEVYCSGNLIGYVVLEKSVAGKILNKEKIRKRIDSVSEIDYPWGPHKENAELWVYNSGQIFYLDPKYRDTYFNYFDEW